MSGQIREKSVEKGNQGTGALGLNHTAKEAQAVHAITQSQPRATLESKLPANTAAQARLLRYLGRNPGRSIPLPKGLTSFII